MLAVYAIIMRMVENSIYRVSYDKRRQLEHRIFLVTAIVVVIFAVISLFMHFVLYPVRSLSDSMAPDIPAGSIELVSPLFTNPHRGDVVLIRGRNESNEHSFPMQLLSMVCRFVSAQQWEPFRSDSPTGEKSVLRRIVALPGDTIYLNNYVLYVKPKGSSHFLTEFELTESKYNVNISAVPVQWDFELGSAGKMNELLLGENQYFVLGDNRIECSDSRVWGPVTRSDIVAGALLKYFPRLYVF